MNIHDYSRDYLMGWLDSHYEGVVAVRSFKDLSKEELFQWFLEIKES